MLHIAATWLPIFLPAALVWPFGQSPGAGLLYIIGFATLQASGLVALLRAQSDQPVVWAEVFDFGATRRGQIVRILVGTVGWLVVSCLTGFGFLLLPWLAFAPLLVLERDLLPFAACRESMRIARLWPLLKWYLVFCLLLGLGHLVAGMLLGISPDRYFRGLAGMLRPEARDNTALLLGAALVAPLALGAFVRLFRVLDALAPEVASAPVQAVRRDRAS